MASRNGMYWKDIWITENDKNFRSSILFRVIINYLFQFLCSQMKLVNLKTGNGIFPNPFNKSQINICQRKSFTLQFKWRKLVESWVITKCALVKNSCLTLMTWAVTVLVMMDSSIRSQSWLQLSGKFLFIYLFSTSYFHLSVEILSRNTCMCNFST